MGKRTIAVRIDSIVAERMRRYCAEHGLKQGFFVQKALAEQIEREDLAEDLLDFKRRRKEESTALSFEEYLKLRRA